MEPPETGPGDAARALYVLRHAKSSWDSDAGNDFERPLAGRGKRDAPRIGEWLHEQGVRPEHVLSSPARRAWQTTRRVCEALLVDAQGVHRDPRIYEAGVQALLEVLSESPREARSVLIVGHNPGLEDLVVYLCGAAGLPRVDKLMPTAAVAGIELSSPWDRLRRDEGRLEFLMHPKML